MKIFVFKLNICDCHKDGMGVVLAFNRGHAVKLINKRLEELDHPPVNKGSPHTLTEIDPSDRAHKKGLVDLSWT